MKARIGIAVALVAVAFSTSGCLDTFVLTSVSGALW